MHARRVVASRGGRYRAVRTRAYAYNQFPPTNLQTYHRTLYPSGALFPRGAGRYPSARWQHVLKFESSCPLREDRQEGYSLSTPSALPPRRFTSFLSYSPRRDRGYFPPPSLPPSPRRRRKGNRRHVAIEMKRYDEIIGKGRGGP